MKDAKPDMPLSELERRVGEIWKDVLGVSDDKAGATFFELQGQSISAVRIVARIEDELGVRVDVGILFEDPTMSTFIRDVVATAQENH
ncbi:MAG TPA: phosphopantetheine-binding protein [Micromonosporaceae bacterium]